MQKTSVATLTICLVLLMRAPALAQFELDPPQGYETRQPDQMLHLSEEQMQRYFPEDAPDFLFRYDPAAHSRIGWPGNDELSPGNREEIWMLDETTAQPLRGVADSRFDSLFIAVWGLVGNRIALYDNSSGSPVLLQELEFPPLSAEYIWLADLTGDGRSEVAISGMTGVSNGGGAFVLRMGDDRQLGFVTEDDELAALLDIAAEAWPQQLWSFYGAMELLRTPEGKWVFMGISPIGRNLTEYFWSYFYEWDDEYGLFVQHGPAFMEEKQFQYGFFSRLYTVLGEFYAHPEDFSIDDPALGYKYAFSDDYGDYSLECFLDEDGTPSIYLIDETIRELEYILIDPLDDSAFAE